MFSDEMTSNSCTQGHQETSLRTTLNGVPNLLSQQDEKEYLNGRFLVLHQIFASAGFVLLSLKIPFEGYLGCQKLFFSFGGGKLRGECATMRREAP